MPQISYKVIVTALDTTNGKRHTFPKLHDTERDAVRDFKIKCKAHKEGIIKGLWTVTLTTESHP